MGNFLWDDPNGAAIGGLIGKLFKQNWDNRSYMKANKLRQEQMNTNANDRLTAEQKVLEELGYNGFKDQNPADLLIANKEKWEEYKRGSDAIYQDFLKYQLANDTEKASSLQDQLNQYKMKMDNVHNQSEMIRSLGAKKGWNLAGLSAQDTLDTARKRLDGTTELMNSIGQNLHYTGAPAEVARQSQPAQGFLSSLDWDNPQDNAMKGYKITSDDLSELLKSNPDMQAKIEQYANANRDKRARSPESIDQFELAMRQQGVDPGVIQNMMMREYQDRQQNKVNYLLDQLYNAKDPQQANKAAMMLAAMGRVDLMSAYTQTNPSPKDDYRFGQQKKAWEIQHNISEDTANANLERTKNLHATDSILQADADIRRANLQRDTMSTQAEIQRKLSNWSREDQIKFWRGLNLSDDQIRAIMLNGGKPRKIPAYGKDVDEAFGKTMQLLEDGDIDGSKEHIDKIERIMNSSEVDSEDRQRMRLYMYIANAKRELIAGNMETFNKYISAIPDEYRKKYGLYLAGNNATLRAPR